MNAVQRIKKRGLNVLFWSVISAAFIGPGTVTTALSAGAEYKLGLLWTLVFATLACVVLQEAVARIAISTGQSIGEIIASKSENNLSKWLLTSAVVFGCAAYQAGNMLGAVSGIELIAPGSRVWWTILLFISSFIILWFGGGKKLMRFLGMLVLVMGIAFTYTAFSLDFSVKDLLFGLKPSIPRGGALLTIGLIGTTIVPYNLFLGSGISKGQTIEEMRSGLVTAIVLGGVISVLILLSGNLLQGSFSFQKMYSVLESQYGFFMSTIFAVGLFAAGFTSSLTSPAAAGITTLTVIGNEDGLNTSSKWFRVTWILVLLVGFLFGVSGFRAVPVIIAAQAINGLLLPFMVIFIALIVNDQRIMGAQFLNRGFGNFFLLLTLAITVFLGIYNLARALISAVSNEYNIQDLFFILIVISALVVFLVVLQVRRIRKLV